MFWAVLLGVGLTLLAIALMLGLGLIAWRWWWDSAMGHVWIEDWKETMKRWRK